MNPIKFIFSTLLNLGYETQLLEACDWDEERAEFVRCELKSAIDSFTLDDPHSTFDEVLISLSDNLSKTISDKELRVCLHILKECSKHSENHGGEYEN
jgi:hypothetical protein